MPNVSKPHKDDFGHGSFLRVFLERSNMEVMVRVTPVVFAVCVLGLISTFTPFAVWVGRPEYILLRYRLLFAGLMLFSSMCGLLSRSYLRRAKPPVGRGEALLLSYCVLLIGSCLWITLVDFPELGRYFFLLVALFAVAGLFFIPPPLMFVGECVVAVAMLGGLKVIGLFSPIQAITLIAYLVTSFAVSVSNYLARVRVGVTNERILAASRHDELTGTLNRRAFEEDANGYVGTDVYVLMVDVDEFNYYNDLYGHSVGDRLLKRLASTLEESFGVSRVYHFGADEFIAVFPGSDEDELKRCVSQCRSLFCEGKTETDDAVSTCSAGCVHGHVSKPEDLRDLLRIADVLLHRSKEQGPDRVTYAEYSEGLSREAITKMAMYELPQKSTDQLTGLMSQEYFLEHAAEIAPIMLQHGHTVSFVYCNVANLKDYNAKYGFAQGDDLLKAVADALATVFPGRMVSRFGDDRFVLMTDDDGLTEAVDRACDLVSEARGARFSSLRAGVFRYTSSEVEIRHACDCARLACESLRGNYDVRCRYYTDTLGNRMAQRSQVLDRFGKALREGYIQPFYQPIVRSTSDAICEFEVLARWIEEDGRVVSPASFIPALESAHLIHLLDLHILEEVCKNFLRFREAGHALCPVSINFSRLDFEACNLVERITDTLDKYGLSHDLVRVEITESAFAEDTSEIKGALDEFHANGFQVWMDDFGSGYSALNVLREYDFDLVKFDMIFLRGLDVNNADDPSAIMLTSLASMAKELGLQTLIEGVERIEDLRFLRVIGFDKIQGFVYGRPRSFTDVCNMIDAMSYVVEDPERRAYYDEVCAVNIMHPDAGTDLFGTAEGLPAAVLENDNGAIRYMAYNAAYLKRLKQHGISGIIESEVLLNTPNEDRSRGMRAAVEAVRDTDEWVTVSQSLSNRGVGYARRVARSSDGSAYSFLYFD